MAVRRGITVHVVEREPEMLRFVRPLLERWIALGFEPEACRRAAEELMRDPQSGADESLLDAAAITRGGMVAKPALLYPPADFALRIRGFEPGSAGWTTRLRFDEDSAVDVAAFLRRLTRHGEVPSDADLDPLPERVRAHWLRPDGVAETPEFPEVNAPGLYRREHGCVILRSRTTTLMLDPVNHWMPHAPRAPLGLRPGGAAVDAIFITHGHADHFNIASILAQAPGAHTPVIVPPVPRASLLAPNDMLATMRLFGQEALAPEWGTTLRVGDIQVEVLPFYGEQPVREGEGPPAELRNWGSCYRFTTPEFSAVALIDSGVDPLGDMGEVLRASVEAHGPVDFVLSSLPRFHCPFFFGLPQYYLSLPFARLRTLFEQYSTGRLPSVTPGADGIVEVCRAGRPRWYLPYGNGFDGLGVPIRDVGMHIGEPSEPDLMRYLSDRFAAEHIPTVAIAWNPGDQVVLRGGHACRRAYGSLAPREVA